MAGEETGGGRWVQAGRTAAILLALVLPSRTPLEAQTEPAWLYTARPGDTIWDLSRRYLIDWERWPEIQAMNRVADPRRIPPGTILRFPTAWLRSVPAEARAMAVEPPADVRPDGQSGWQALEADRLLGEGDAIATGVGGSAALELADRSLVLLPGQTRIVLERLRRFDGTPLADSSLRLEEGRLLPSKVALGSSLSIATPPGITSVRGTTFRVALGEEASRLASETLEGSLAVTGEGREIRVGAGFGTTTQAGRPPRPPVPLLPPPDLGTVPARTERVPFTLDLRPLTGAVGYRLEVSADQAFTTLLVDAVSEGPLVRVPPLPDGIYVFRTRGIDGLGLEGRNAQRSIEVDARPEPPAPLRPRRAERVRDPTPRFAWAEPVEATGYRVRVAPATAPGRTLIDRDDVERAEFTPAEALPVGEYVWQIATRAPDGEIGPLSDPQPFSRLEALPVPEPEVAAATSDETVVRLPAATQGARYQVQLARDPAFTDVAVDRLLDEPELALKHLYPDRYYLRARTIEADGFEGAYSAPQGIDVAPARWWPLVAIPLGILLLAL
jgi:hypothetical protein